MILNKLLYDKHYPVGSFSKRLFYLYKVIRSLLRLRFYLDENQLNVPLLIENKTGLLCTACGLCQLVCPSKCIDLEAKSFSESSMNGDLKSFQLDFSKCIQCYKCEEVCPEEAIQLKFVSHERIKDSSILNKEELTFNFEETIIDSLK